MNNKQECRIVDLPGLSRLLADFDIEVHWDLHRATGRLLREFPVVAVYFDDLETTLVYANHGPVILHLQYQTHWRILHNLLYTMYTPKR